MVAFFLFKKGSEQVRTFIEVSCTDQDIKVINNPVVASGGLHENFILFDFCEKWNGLTMTGVFYRDGKKIEPFYSVVDGSNICEVPHEVTDTPGIMYFGVFGVLNDVVKTSKIVPYKVQQGAITTDLVPTDPTPEIWEQVLSEYNKFLKEVATANQAQQEFISNANRVLDNCTSATDECYNAIAILNHQAIDLDGGDPSTEEIAEDQNNIDGGTPY